MSPILRWDAASSRGQALLCSLLALGIGACADSDLAGPGDPAGRIGSDVGQIRNTLPQPGDPPGPSQAPSFIVTLRDGTDPSSVAASFGIETTHVYSHVFQGFAGGVSEAARAGLLQDARVLSVERDLEVTTMDDQTNAPWGLDRIDQRSDSLNGVYTYAASGTGVTAYIVDTGIRYTHQEFGGRARFGFDAFGEDGVDCHGHGTHVAGTVGGSTFGVAKGVDIVGVRVLDCAGSGTTSSVVAGLDWVAANASGPSVVNMSLGGGASDALDDAVRRLIASGVAVVVAAGNSGTDACSTSPARVDEAMTVGASDATDLRAWFSNLGPCVDWFAPGVDIVSAYNAGDAATAVFSGTSMASPHTAGAVALLLERRPGIAPGEARDSLWSYTTKNVVVDAFSENAHLLSTLTEADADMGDPPGEAQLETPINFSVDLSTTEARIDIHWQNVDSRANWIEIGLKWAGQESWYIVKRKQSFYSDHSQLLQGGTDYEVSVRAAEELGAGAWRYSDWAESVFVRTCDANNSGKCTGGGSGSDGSDGGTTQEKGNKGGNGKGKGNTT